MVLCAVKCVCGKEMKIKEYSHITSRMNILMLAFCYRCYSVKYDAYPLFDIILMAFDKSKVLENGYVSKWQLD